MNRVLNPPKNPDAFAGVGGCVYFNPAAGASNTMKRDRNYEAPYSSLSDVEKAGRIVKLQDVQVLSREAYKALCESIEKLNAEDHKRAEAAGLTPVPRAIPTYDEAVKSALNRMLDALSLTAEERAALTVSPPSASNPVVAQDAASADKVTRGKAK
jgi:hypothetical protein